MNDNKLNLDEFLSCFVEQHDQIKLSDNKRNIAFTVDRDSNEISIKLERKFKVNSKMQILFEELKKYSNSINDTSKYWPNDLEEYPDLMILWEIVTELGNETSKKNGVLGYPENWDRVISWLLKEIIDILDV